MPGFDVKVCRACDNHKNLLIALFDLASSKATRKDVGLHSIVFDLAFTHILFLLGIELSA